jgi:hypothetical protein
MLVLALAILLQLSLRHHLSAMAALLPGILNSGRTICYLGSPVSKSGTDFGEAMATDYVGDRRARTNEINLKGYEPTLVVIRAPIGALSQSDEPLVGGSKRSRACIISVHRV